MTLYHGSYVVVRSPDVVYGREEVDFGQGFYLTRLRKQAIDWARVSSVSIERGGATCEIMCW